MRREAKKDWARAETWYRRDAERYPENSWAVWYFFCKRTGHGDMKAARESVEQYVTARADRPDLLNPEYAACYFWFDGNVDKAKEAFRKAVEKTASFSATLSLAMIANDENDTAATPCSNDIVTKRAAEGPNSAAMCKLLLDTVLSPSGKKPFDAAAADRLIDKVTNDKKAGLRFLAGWFLKNHGDVALAKTYLRSSRSDSPQLFVWYR